MKRRGVPVDGDVHGALARPALLHDEIFGTGQNAAPTELGPVAYRADLSPLQHGFQREGERVTQGIVT